jgi:hypothetical protein
MLRGVGNQDRALLCPRLRDRQRERRNKLQHKRTTMYNTTQQSPPPLNKHCSPEADRTHLARCKTDFRGTVNQATLRCRSVLLQATPTSQSQSDTYGTLRVRRRPIGRSPECRPVRAGQASERVSGRKRDGSGTSTRDGDCTRGPPG